MNSEIRRIDTLNRGRFVTEEVKVSRWMIVVLVLFMFCSIGFPGNYTKVFGDTFKMLIDYTLFLLQIAIMLITSGNSMQNIKIIDLKSRYWSIYIFLLIIFLVSMIGTSNRIEETVSCVRFSVTALFALWIIDHLTLEKIMECLYRAQIMYVAAAVAFAVLFPGYYERQSDQETAFLGMEDTKNVTAQILCFGILMQLVLWKVYSSHNKSVSRFFVIFFVAQCVLLFLADSTSAILICIIVGVLTIIFGDRLRINLGLMCVIASVVFLIMAMTILPVMEPALNAIGKDATLTGRIPLWQQILDVIRENHTMVGYGYGHFWFDDEAVELIHAGFSKQSFMSHMTAGAHNNLLEMWLNTGLIGLIAYFGMLIIAFSHPGKISAENYLFCLTFMSFYTLCGFTERGWTTYNYKVFALFLAAGFACKKNGQEEDGRAEAGGP